MKKGERMSKEQKLRQSISMRGRPSKFKGMKGRYSEETLRKIGEKSKGRKHNIGRKRPDLVELNRKLKTGTKHKKESREKISNSLVGKFAKEKNPMWKGGITPVNTAIRTSRDYKIWRIAVFERDNYTCIWCGVRDGELNADHIKPFAWFPELRFAIDNGRTLCVPCHKTTDTYARPIYRKGTDTGC